MKVDLTLDEVLALHDLAAYAFAFNRKSHEDPDTADLRKAKAKLEKAAKAAQCKHCRERFSRRKDRICDPCNTYRSKYGRLPAHDVVARRAS